MALVLPIRIGLENQPPIRRRCRGDRQRKAAVRSLHRAGLQADLVRALADDHLDRLLHDPPGDGHVLVGEPQAVLFLLFDDPGEGRVRGVADLDPLRKRQIVLPLGGPEELAAVEVAFRCFFLDFRDGAAVPGAEQQAAGDQGFAERVDDPALP